MLFKNTRQVGNKGEDLACKFLRKQGYQILERNYLIRGGEIDIIARDKGILVFVEVKMRSGHVYGFAREAVTPWKLHFLQRAALFYLQKTNWSNQPYRFDLVAIDIDSKQSFSASDNTESIELIKNIT